jgi:hypothetical protein
LLRRCVKFQKKNFISVNIFPSKISKFNIGSKSSNKASIAPNLSHHKAKLAHDSPLNPNANL